MTIDWKKPIEASRPSSGFTYPARLIASDLLTGSNRSLTHLIAVRHSNRDVLSRVDSHGRGLASTIIRNVAEKPTANESNAGAYDAHPDMSLRDYFAGQALMGMLAHATRYRPRHGAPPNWHDAISQEAYQIADAMLVARETSHAE